MIDLRSDTVTMPGRAMREAIATAEVGDDVLGEDPTINLLQDKMASLLGQGAGLFVPSGTMANQVAIKTHIQPGDEILIDQDAHIYYYECAATAVIAGGQFHCLKGDNGILSPEAIAAAIRPPDIHQPPSRLVCLENTHNRGGGTIYTVERTTSITKLASSQNIKVHLDGARLFNAALAARTTVKELTGGVDSVSICFSKGLGAPVGSVLCGSADFIAEARRFRKMFGGGMRQVGILAAACLYALDHHVERLEEDHENARRLAVAGTGLDADSFSDKLATEGVLTIPFGPTTVRAVTHMDVRAVDIDRALEIIAHFLKSSAR
jgi:threonine aldolase